MKLHANQVALHIALLVSITTSLVVLVYKLAKHIRDKRHY